MTKIQGTESVCQ